ncbi:uncharacterized protein LOC106174824 [Lingula anatina]|uniref:Uncharacterized protein LOC106174824 n=1 Tax=Lingula anatina TaxID=7574 RepID=A0A2R2MRC9_LINAN|nr:uncharacterized protein LOC106174824 [Lingula anatina]|eukprot:XP_023932572.1 uncharacterized protein LOC106174824 [Lingula anatina]
MASLKILLVWASTLMLGVYGQTATPACLISTPSQYEYKFVRDVSRETNATFEVKAAENAHIILAPDLALQTDTSGRTGAPGFEIVIGDNKNSESCIRNGTQGPCLVTVKTPNILDGNGKLSFWVSWAKGVIKVGRGKVVGVDTFMQWKSPGSVDVRKMFVATGFGAKGEWQFPVCDKECGKDVNADVLFVIDESGSVGRVNNEKLKKFLADLVLQLPVAQDKIRVGVISFSTRVRHHFSLNQFDKPRDVADAIMNMNYSSGGTNTADALWYAQRTSFSKASGDRSTAPNLLFLFTDGYSVQSPVSAAGNATKAGIEIFTIGIGRGVSIPEITQIASEPKIDHVFTVAGFDALTTIKNTLGAKFCAVKDNSFWKTGETKNVLNIIPKSKTCKRGIRASVALGSPMGNDATRTIDVDFPMNFTEKPYVQAHVKGHQTYEDKWETKIVDVTPTGFKVEVKRVFKKNVNYPPNLPKSKLDPRMETPTLEYVAYLGPVCFQTDVVNVGPSSTPTKVIKVTFPNAFTIPPLVNFKVKGQERGFLEQYKGKIIKVTKTGFEIEVTKSDNKPWTQETVDLIWEAELGPCTCRAVGDPHFQTCDGQQIHFQGTCTYVMAAVCSCNRNLPRFEVRVKPESRHGSTMSWTRYVEASLGPVVVRLGPGKNVTVNGLAKKVPFSAASVPYYNFTVDWNNELALVTDFGLKLTFNYRTAGFNLEIPMEYSNQLCGICGNFDGNKGNDLRMKNGQVIETLSVSTQDKYDMVGNSWETYDQSGDPRCNKVSSQRPALICQPPPIITTTTTTTPTPTPTITTTTPTITTTTTTPTITTTTTTPTITTTTSTTTTTTTPTPETTTTTTTTTTTLSPPTYCSNSKYYATIKDICGFTDTTTKWKTLEKCVSYGNKIDISLYKVSCESDACAAMPDTTTAKEYACDILEFLAQECENKVGIPVFSYGWRNETNCPKKCDSDKEYQTNVTECQPACPGAPQNCDDPTKMVPESCVCKPGTILDGTDCIQPANCVPKCWDNGNTYQVGDQLLIDNCKTEITCNLVNGKASLSKKAVSCSPPPSAECKTANGTRRCVCLPGYTGDGYSCLRYSGEFCHKRNPCDTNPCKNGGICKEDATKSK